MLANTLTTGPVTHAIRAMRTEPEPVRRGFLVGLLTLPWIGSVANASVPSDLAQSCLWAVRHDEFMSVASASWDDDRVEAEAERYTAAFQRAIAEPSRSISDVQAKARLALHDYENCLFPDIEGAKSADRDAALDDCQRLLRVVLREIATISA